jgi:hypothetical protein
MTDRGFWVAAQDGGLNVRRLMYQSLIWPVVLGDDAGGLRTAFDTQCRKRLADALIHRMRRDPKLGRNLFGTKMLVDQTQAIELSWRQARDAPGDDVVA